MIVKCPISPTAADSYEDMSAWVRKVCAACGLSAAQDEDDTVAAGADENDQGRERLGGRKMENSTSNFYFSIERLRISIAFSLKNVSSPL